MLCGRYDRDTSMIEKKRERLEETFKNNMHDKERKPKVAVY